MNKFHTIILATYLLNLCTPAYSRSEIIGYDVFNLTLEELLNVEVITASKTLEGQWSAPSVMTVISAEEIQLFGSRSLAEVLQKVVGIQPYFSSTYGLNFLSVRGDTQSNVDARTLVLVDGRPMFRSSITHGSNVTPYTLFPVETLQRIEVIRGPGSVLYGSGAFSSVINLITEDSKESNASVKIGIGSFDTFDATLNASYFNNDVSFQSATRFIDQSGDDFNAVGVDGIPTQTKYFNNSSFLSQNTLRWQGLKASLIRSRIERMVWFPSLQVKEDDVPRFENELTSIDMEYSWKINHSLTVTANSSFHREDYLNVFNSTDDDIASHTIDGRAYNEDYTYEITVFGNHNSVGVNYVVGLVRDRSTGEDSADPENPFSLPTFSPGSWDYWINSAFFQGNYAFNNHLSITVGAQYNDPDFASGDISPRLGLVGNHPSGFGFKLLYGEAFRAPVVAERFFVGSRTIGNPNLKNELIATTELQLAHHTDKSEISLTLYKSELTEIINSFPVPGSTLLQTENQGERSLQGIEIEGKLNFLARWYLTGNYSWQQNESDGTTDATLQPRWLANIGLGIRDSNYHIGLFDTILSRYRKTSLINPEALTVNPDSEIYHLVSASTSWYFDKSTFNGKTVELKLSVNNLLDEDINIPDFSTYSLNTVPGGSGRSVLASIKLGI